MLIEKKILQMKAAVENVYIHRGLIKNISSSQIDFSFSKTLELLKNCFSVLFLELPKQSLSIQRLNYGVCKSN